MKKRGGLYSLGESKSTILGSSRNKSSITPMSSKIMRDSINSKKSISRQNSKILPNRPMDRKKDSIHKEIINSIKYNKSTEKIRISQYNKHKSKLELLLESFNRQINDLNFQILELSDKTAKLENENKLYKSTISLHHEKQKKLEDDLYNLVDSFFNLEELGTKEKINTENILNEQNILIRQLEADLNILKSN